MENLPSSIDSILKMNEMLERLRPTVASVAIANAVAQYVPPIPTATLYAAQYKPPIQMPELTAMYKAMEAAEWRQNLLPTLVKTASMIPNIDLYKGISIASTAALCQSLPVGRTFDVQNYLSTNINIANQITPIGEILAGYKQSRIITNHLDFTFKGIKIDYDFTKIQESEDEGESKIIKPKAILTEARIIRKIILDIYRNNAKLYNLEPREFEKMIAALLDQKGYKTELTKQTRDGGFDIIALSTDNGMPLKYLVECKKYKKERKVGIEIIRSFSDVIREQDANRGIIFTTSYFSDEAWKRQKSKPYFLQLNDHDEVINWVRNYAVSTS